MASIHGAFEANDKGVVRTAMFASIVVAQTVPSPLFCHALLLWYLLPMGVSSFNDNPVSLFEAQWVMLCSGVCF